MGMAWSRMVDSTAATSLNDSLLQHLECPVCMETCTTPIYMCVNGHTICAKCQPRVQECPVCRTPGAPAIRNIPMEGLCGKVVMACKFHKVGCEVRLCYQDLDDHYSRCEYRYKCMLGCDWAGRQNALHKHVEENHPYAVDVVNKVIELSFHSWLEEDACYVKLYLWKRELFWFKHLYSTKNATNHFYLQYIGPSEKALRYKMVIKFTSDDGKTSILKLIRPSLSWSEDFRSSDNTVVLHKSLFDMMAGPSKSIKIQINITDK